MSPTPSEPEVQPTPFTASGGGVKVRVKVTPKARHERIQGIVVGADGEAWLKLAVTAPPELGKANAAAVALLARTWRLPKSAFAVTKGAADRAKTITVAGEPDTLLARLAAATEAAKR